MNPVKHLSLWSSSLSSSSFFLSSSSSLMSHRKTIVYYKWHRYLFPSMHPKNLLLPLLSPFTIFFFPSHPLFSLSFPSISFFVPTFPLPHFCVSVFSHSSTPPLTTFFLTIFSQIKDRSTEHKNHSLVSTESFFFPHFCEEEEDRRLTDGLG